MDHEKVRKSVLSQGGWNARDRTIIARTKQFLERSYSVKVRAEELERFLRPEDVEWISGES